MSYEEIYVFFSFVKAYVRDEEKKKNDSNKIDQQKKMSKKETNNPYDFVIAVVVVINELSIQIKKLVKEIITRYENLYQRWDKTKIVYVI